MKTAMIQEQASEESFEIKNQGYVLLTFTKENAPDLQGAIAIAERRGEKMLAVGEARELIADYESRAVLSKALNSDKRIVWSYLNTGSFSHTAASIGNDWSSRELRIAEHTDDGIYQSQTLLLKRAKPVEAQHLSDFRTVMLRKLRKL